MATYFAEKDVNGTILRVIVADQSFIDSGAVGDSANWVQTYPEQVANPKKNYAGVGWKWDKALEAFVSPMPHQGWVLDADARWQAPIEIPVEGGPYYWDDTEENWLEIPN